MAGSMEALNTEDRGAIEDWKIVSRRGKQKKKLPPRVISLEQQQQTWVPTDTDIDPERESKLMKNIQICTRGLENSEFYRSFLHQIQSQILDHFLEVLHFESQMQMVIYGVGSIEWYENPRLQLGLAILMKRKFSWIGEIEVFDPVLSATESRVLKALGCSVLSINELGRRQALKPTLFFMPHCEAELYSNLLRANWRVDLLNHVVLFGNSLKTYQQHVFKFKNSTVADKTEHILASGRFTKEYGLGMVSDNYCGAFNDSSWHFFPVKSEVDLQFMEQK